MTRSLLERRFEAKLVQQLDDLDAKELVKNEMALVWGAKDRVALFEVVADYLAAQRKRGEGDEKTWGAKLPTGGNDGG